MTSRTLEGTSEDAAVGEAPVESPDPEPRRRTLRVALWAVAIAGTLVVAAVVWFLLGRESAEPLTSDDALEGFRATAGSAGEAQGRPRAGVYRASASGSESIGIPGLDEDLGPDVPVTVTYSDEGCFTYRADFNSHHWRSWELCPDEDAIFSLVELQSWTARKAPAFDVKSLSTYTCEQPPPVLWDEMEPGEKRTGACTGTMDSDDSVTKDRASVEVTGTESITVGTERVDAIRLRTVDELSEDQTGMEEGEWWLEPTTGLPLRVVIESNLSGGAATYSENFDLRLDTLSPDT